MTTPVPARRSIYDLVHADGAQHVLRPIKIASPAAGADFTIPVPPGVVWKVESLLALLTTSAVVANRQVSLRLGSANEFYGRVPAVASVTATLAIEHAWMKEFSPQPPIALAAGVANNFPPLLLQQGDRIVSSTAGIDAGDQWSAIVVYVLELRPARPGQLDTSAPST